jgi:ribosomal protein S12 methylthiotransferase accessory factor
MTDMGRMPGMPVRYRDASYALHKRYTRGNSDRTLLPEETLDKIKPYFPAIGLTRLGNITGLDRAGIPITVAIRPNSYSLTQSSGKGISLAAALTSAAMESIELYCAEHIRQKRIRASYNEIRTQFQTIDLHALHFSRHSLFHVDRPEEWLIGWDIMQQREVAVPYHSVTLDFRVLNQLDCPASFTMDSNGLASGNHFLEALLAGLYEVIERDGVSCHSEAERYGWKKKRIDMQQIEDDIIQELATTLRATDLVPIILDCTTDIGVPTFEAYLYDLRSNLVPISHGYGAHLTPATAIMRALTEAVQARTLIISGGRDDLFKDIYNANRIRYTSLVKHVETKETSLPLEHTNRAHPTFEEDAFLLMERLSQVGLKHVIVFDLSPESVDISVLRVVVPGLEGYFYYGYNPRSRAYRFIERVCDPAIVAQITRNPLAREASTHSPAGGII